MHNQNKFTRVAKLAISAMVVVSLSGCYLSIGGGGKRKRADDDTNIVVTTGGQAAPPTIINNMVPTQQSGERSLKPINH